MAEFEVSDAKRQLVAMGQRRNATVSRRRPSRRRPLLRSPDEPDALGAYATGEEAARRGLDSRPAGWAQFGDEPEIITLDKPFMILDLRNGDQGLNILVADNVESMNSWAKVDSWLNKPDDFVTYDEVGFYFYWTNDTGKDAAVNVSSLLNLHGSCSATAYDGWIWTPIWNVGDAGMSAVTLTTQLRMWQWWNQPPTPPASQSGQFRDVVHIGVEGGWLPIPGDSWEKTETSVSDSYHVNYDMLEVPKGGTAVFEVTLNIAYEVANGTAGAFFAGTDDIVQCPFVRLENLSASSSSPPVSPR